MAGRASGGIGRTHRRGGPVALQDALDLQVVETPEDLTRRALQDALRCQGPVLIGLIAHLSDSALQDDIATTTRGLLQLGQDILSGQHLMPHKRVLRPDRLRRVPPQFSWIDQRLVRDRISSAVTYTPWRCIWCWSPSPICTA